MSIASMQKVQIFAHASSASGVLDALQKLAIIEITEVDEDLFTRVEPSGDNKVFDEAFSFLQRLFPTSKNIIENFIEVKVLASAGRVKEILAARKKLMIAARAVVRDKARYEAIRQQLAQLQSEAERLQMCLRFPVTVKKLALIKKVRLFFGSFTKAQYLRWGKLRAERGTEFQFVHVEVLSSDEKHEHVVFCIFPEQEAALKAMLQQLGFTEMILPVESTVPFAKQLAQVQKGSQKLAAESAKLLASFRQAYQEYREPFAILADHLQNSEQLQTWGAGLLHTKKVALIEGWIEKARYPELQQALLPWQEGVYILEAPHSEDDQPPIKLANSWARPFEAVTSIYGLPHTAEYDPTPLLAGFFIVFYGLCLSDAGYGFLLFLWCTQLLKKYRTHLTPYGVQLLTLNKWCGVSTMVVGMLTGSYFAMNIQALTWLPLRDLLLSLQVIDPVRNPLPMLIFSLILGVVQLYVGLWIRYMIDIKNKGQYEAFLSSGVWVYFISGIILWPISGGLLHSGLLLLLSKFVVWSGALALVATQGRHQKNPVMRFFSGILSLYRLTGYVGDILSYSRLFALGLVTAVLGMVINLLAMMTMSIPVVGVVVMVFILITGHLFDFLINLLGSFVHPARLQYVEYFSKFFDGGGKPFRPITWQPKYMKVVEQGVR